jgi:hypothetical protein
MKHVNIYKIGWIVHTIPMKLLIVVILSPNFVHV